MNRHWRLLFSSGMQKRSAFWPLWLVISLAAMPLPAQNPPVPTPAPTRAIPPFAALAHPATEPSSTAPDVPVLAFDAETKRYEAAPGESGAPFTFNLTNIWSNEVVIERVQASCGCTTTSLPALPWHLPPGASGQVHAQMNLAAKMGLITKQLKFFLSAGANHVTQSVNLEVNIPPPPALGGSLSEAERQAAMAQAQLNPQAIFKGDCAACHADRGRNAEGEDLYAADCGICHESSRRASVVPDLHALKQTTDFDYWKTLIIYGKPHTTMPAFALGQGGPLSEAQITSLATYLNHTLSHHLSPGMTNAASAPVRTIIIR
jgi:mono/diheme cytochrome c family protein